MQTYQFRWDIIPNNLDFLMSGLQMTLFISATALVCAMLGGLLLAIIDMSRFFVVRAIGIKRLVPLLAIGGVALGVLAARGHASAEEPAE